MIIGTFNTRGCGRSMKRRRIGQIIRKINPDVMFFQETKAPKMSEVLVSSLWGAKEYGWSARDSEGSAGGILTVWRKDIIQPVFSFSGKGFLGIKASNKGQVLYLINIYSPCSLLDKRTLWREILSW